MLYFLSDAVLHADCREFLFGRNGFCDGFGVCDDDQVAGRCERREGFRALDLRCLIHSAPFLAVGEEEHLCVLIAGGVINVLEVCVEVLCGFGVIQDDE